jgi:hypothetical protein
MPLKKYPCSQLIILEKQQQRALLIGFLHGTSVKKQGAAMLLKFSNFIKNEKETVKMLICGSEKQVRTDTKRT